MQRAGPSTLHDVLQAHSGRTPDAVVIGAPGCAPLTYRGLLEHVDMCVRRLRALGIGPQDRVAIALPNGPDLAVAFLAVSSGAISAPLDPMAGAEELRFAMSTLRARMVMVPSGADAPARAAARALGIEVLELAPVAGAPAGAFAIATRALPGPASAISPGEDHVALLLTTSGTTSRPKVVPLTHRNMLNGASNIAASLELRAPDRCLNMAPLFHGAGLLASVLSSVLSGASVVCCPGFDQDRFFDWLDAFRPTWYGAVPAIHAVVAGAAALTPDRAANTSLRFIRSGSAPLPSRLRAQLERLFGVPVIESYALSEAVQLASTSYRPQERKVGSVGIPAGIEVAILSDAGALLPRGQVGEIVCRGPSVMRGYDGDASSTRAAFVNGWLRTGDQGFLDADGYLFLTGRIKEIINRGGAKVSPQEIDAVLLEHPAIGHAVTFPLPHDELGESIAAAVVLQPGAHSSAQEIRAFVAARLSPFKVPSRIIITTHIPTGPTGKVQRFALSEQLRVRPLGPSRDAEDVGRRLVAPRDLLEARLLRIWESFFGGGPIGVADDFFDLGGHSLLAARLVEEIERASGRRLHPSILIEAPTVERLARAMLRDSARQPLLRIRDGHRSPLFFLNGDLNGGGFYCVKLASGLEPGQSFYSVSSHGIGGDPIPGSIEAIAASHIGAIRTVQPAGPYLLGGFSHAGLVAFEMASQLEAAGEKVALLFVVDVSADPALRRRSPGPVSRTLVRWGGRFTRLHREMSELGSRDRIALALHTLRRYGSRAASPSAVELDGSEMTKDGRRLFETYRRLMDRYVARPYSGRMTLVVSADDLGARSTDPMLGWGRLADVKVLSIPGTHVACVTRHVGILAEHLRASLREITI